MKQAVFAVGRMKGTLLLVVMASSAFAVEELSLEYDAEGNVQYLTTPDGTTDYDYDAIYRLTDEDGPYHTETYGYDANGNRTSDNPGTLEYPVSPSPPSSRVSNRVTTGGTTPYVHDANGNVTDDGTYEYVYNQRGLLEQVKQSSTVIATYYYDYRNRRTRKVTSAGTTVYHYDQWDKLIGETTTASEPDRTYVYGANDAPVAQVSDDGLAETVAYLSTDHIATPRLGKDANRRVVWRWDRDAFGDLPADSDPDGDLTATSMNLRFPGQYYDAETGLHYNWNRYYAPNIGRYIQGDPLGLRGGLNAYAYVENNPMRYSDPDGQLAVNPVTGAVAGFIAGGIGAFAGTLGGGRPFSEAVAAAGEGALYGLASGFVLGFGGAGISPLGQKIAIGSGIGLDLLLNGASGAGAAELGPTKNLPTSDSKDSGRADIPPLAGLGSPQRPDDDILRKFCELNPNAPNCKDVLKCD